MHDLNALLKFLKAYPFDSTSYFDLHITRLLETDEQKAFKNLKKLFQCVALRRTKRGVMDQLLLPPRFDKYHVVEFSHQERTLYDVLRKSLFQFFRSFGEDVNKDRSNASVLQTITRLRRFCNHGLDLLPLEIGTVLKGSADEKEIAQALTTSLRTCDSCNAKLSNGDLSRVIVTSFECGHTLCSRCLPEQQESSYVCLLCFGFDVSHYSFNVTKHWKSEESHRNYQPSSKVSALLENLLAERTIGSGIKRYQDS